MNLVSEQPRGIYLHFPFCLKKCSYCDFYSLPIVPSNSDLVDRYIDSLIKEIKLRAPKYKNTEIETVYFGGGTPSLLNNRQFSLLINSLSNNFSLSNNVEITLEANPATITKDKLQSYKASGLNRLSLGVQSFSSSELSLLGRSHSVKEVFTTVDLIHKSGLKNFSLDLIYGIPYQSLAQWLNNLELATSLAPSHISIYLLQLDPKTPLGRQVVKGKLSMLGDETEWIMYNDGIKFLDEKGYEQYEISNFSKPNYKSRHNIIYWQSLRYLGFGSGAVSFVDQARCINKPRIADYISNLASGELPPSENLEIMDTQGLIQDAIILGLRLTQGINVEEFNHRFNIDLLLQYEKAIRDSINKKLLKMEKGYLSLTKTGYFLSNQVLFQFIGD